MLAGRRLATAAGLGLRLQPPRLDRVEHVEGQQQDDDHEGEPLEGQLQQALRPAAEETPAPKKLFKRDEQSQWENTNSFGVNDLARVQLVVGEAFRLLALADEAKPKDGNTIPEVEEVKVD